MMRMTLATRAEMSHRSEKCFLDTARVLDELEAALTEVLVLDELFQRHVNSAIEKKKEINKKKEEDLDNCWDEADPDKLGGKSAVPVSPIVLRDGGDVDLLRLGIIDAQVGEERKELLEREDGEE